MGFGNLGIWELLVVGLLALIVFGPRRLPEIARSMGSALREFKRGMNEIQRELQEAEREATLREPPPSPAGNQDRRTIGESRSMPERPRTADGPPEPGGEAPAGEPGTGGSGGSGTDQAELFGESGPVSGP